MFRMTKKCQVEGCERAASGSCFCCNKNVCRRHFLEHSDNVKAQIDPLANDTNEMVENIQNCTIEKLTEPAFAHHEAAELPIIEGEGKLVRLIAGSLYGARSPVLTRSDLFYADVTLEAGAKLQLPTEHEERAVYIVAGSVELTDNSAFNASELLVFKPGEAITLRASSDAPVRLMLLGGAPLDSPRHIWWNFVSSSKERIEQAKQDWQSGRFALVPEETEFIPLPEPVGVR